MRQRISGPSGSSWSRATRRPSVTSCSIDRVTYRRRRFTAGQAQVVMKIRAGRVQPHGMPQLFGGIFMPTHVAQHRRQVVAGAGRFRRKGERLAQQSQRSSRRPVCRQIIPSRASARASPGSAASAPALALGFHEPPGRCAATAVLNLAGGPPGRFLTHDSCHRSESTPVSARTNRLPKPEKLPEKSRVPSGKCQFLRACGNRRCNRGYPTVKAVGLDLRAIGPIATECAHTQSTAELSSPVSKNAAQRQSSCLQSRGTPHGIERARLH